MTAPLNTLPEKTTISQTLHAEYINTQVYPPLRMTLFLTALTLLLSNLYKKSPATTSTFLTTLPYLLPPQTTHAIICYSAEPSTLLMSTVTAASTEAEPKLLDTTTAAHI